MNMRTNILVNKIAVSIFILLFSFTFYADAKTTAVGNFPELLSGINDAESGDTILMRDETYTVNNGYGAQIRKNNLVIKSKLFHIFY
jgi:hypothetical protein